MSNLARTLRSVCHLLPSQIYWRLRYLRAAARPVVSPPVPATLAVRDDFPASLLAAAHAPDLSEEELDELEWGRFTYLNESRYLGTDPVDWQLGSCGAGRLWTITLHYHAWAWRLARLVERGGELSARADWLLRRYLGDWITRCDLTADGSRYLAWNSYAIATRIGWWCRLYHLLGNSGRAKWGPLETVFLESLWTQAAYLRNHLEWDLRANHLLRDAVGLAWAGRFFHGPRAKQWLASASQLAVRQAAEQVLADGGHFERSPMYHVEVMDDFLTLAVLLEDKDEDARRCLTQTWHRMAEWLAWVRHPDGQVPLLNDGALNGSCEPAAAFAKGRRCLGVNIDTQLPAGGRLLPDFGLAVWHGRPWSLFFDVGLVGVDYQPGHAHADTLTIEASYEGHRVFVDPGTLRYDDDESRRYDRATASHNTVAIDGVNSTDVWHIFRVGRRAQPVDVRFEATQTGLLAAAAHTGYDRLPGRPRHRREIRLDPTGVLTLVDRFEGRGQHAVSAGLLLHPDWEATETADGWQLRRGEKALRVVIEGNRFDRSVRRVEYHPEYGLSRPANRLTWQAVLQLPYVMTVRLEPYPAS
jgi:uncharacterized heparinase superfamily protein